MTFVTLTEKEYKEFLKIHLDLLYFVGQQGKIISSETTFREFLNLNFRVKYKCRKALFENEDMIDEYIASNFDHLSKEDVQTLEGFKKKIHSDFVILKCLTNHAIFMDTKDNRFYAVKALGDPFDRFFNQFPVNITTTLIPFRDQIIYDGFIDNINMYYGKNISRALNDDYKIAKQNKAITARLGQ
jgi:succinate dehydrogenase flavin-adding protein (antitoxin of CptAB toxin-antitoxin module)